MLAAPYDTGAPNLALPVSGVGAVSGQQPDGTRRQGNGKTYVEIGNVGHRDEGASTANDLR